MAFPLELDYNGNKKHSQTGKGKVKLSLCLTKHHAMKVYLGV